jgi:cellulose synthase/poly-beta-1,6-N-acetylglucosamine synthase-like glycosyltransferase
MFLFLLTFIIVSAVYFMLILIYTIGWERTQYFLAETPLPRTKISVVIAARNEEKNIGACLSSITNQNYPKDLFEVIVVDDYSEDETVNIAAKFENCKVIKLQNDSESTLQSYKKFALTRGIESASGKLIVVADADCVAKNNWLTTVASFFEAQNAKMIIMPVRFENENSLLNTFQQMDLSGLIGITAGSLFWNFPVMANGGNMAFEKKAFEAVRGFLGNENIPGGDDIFLLLKIKKQFPGSVNFLKSDQAIVTTKAADAFNDFFNQRIRWLSKSGKFGDWKITAVLVLSYLFNLFLVFGFILSIIFNSEVLLFTAITILLIKWTTEFMLVKKASDFLNHTFTVQRFIFSNLVHQWYVIVFGVLSLIKKYTWKGRKY